MTEEEELKKLEEKKQKIELKYAKKAKKRLTQISNVISKNNLIVDMSNDDFEILLKRLNNFDRAEKRLGDLSRILKANEQILVMSDKDYKQYLDQTKQMIDYAYSVYNPQNQNQNQQKQNQNLNQNQQLF